MKTVIYIPDQLNDNYEINQRRNVEKYIDFYADSENNNQFFLVTGNRIIVPNRQAIKKCYNECYF